MFVLYSSKYRNCSFKRFNGLKIQFNAFLASAILGVKLRNVRHKLLKTSEILAGGCAIIGTFVWDKSVRFPS